MANEIEQAIREQYQIRTERDTLRVELAAANARIEELQARADATESLLRQASTEIKTERARTEAYAAALVKAKTSLENVAAIAQQSAAELNHVPYSPSSRTVEVDLESADASSLSMLKQSFLDGLEEQIQRDSGSKLLTGRNGGGART